MDTAAESRLVSPAPPPPTVGDAGRRRGRHRPRNARRSPWALVLFGLIGAAPFVLSLLGLLVRVPWADAAEQLNTPVVRSALWLSLVCSVSATVLCVVLGVPLAWLQVRSNLPGRRLLQAFTTLPVVLPPVVSGVALLLVFGRHGLIGRWLWEAAGIQLAFSMPAVILAETFVAMPFLVLALSGALQSADQRLEDAARTLGASPWRVFWQVTLPLIRPSLAAGAVLAWARALGEFGATITFAGNFPGRTQTLPLAVYTALEVNPDAAITLSLVLVAVSLVILVTMRRRWFGAV